MSPVGCDEHFGTCFLEFWGSTLCRRHCLSDVDSKGIAVCTAATNARTPPGFQAACTQLQLADGVMTPWFPTFSTLAKKCLMKQMCAFESGYTGSNPKLKGSKWSNIKYKIMFNYRMGKNGLRHPMHVRSLYVKNCACDIHPLWLYK